MNLYWLHFHLINFEYIPINKLNSLKVLQIIWQFVNAFLLLRDEGRYLTQSYDKSPYTNKKHCVSTPYGH